MNRIFSFATVSLIATASFVFACSDDTADVGAQSNQQQSAGASGANAAGTGGSAAGTGGSAAGTGGSAAGSAGSNAAGTGGSGDQTCDSLGGVCTGVGDCGKGKGFITLADPGSLACVGGDDAVCCLPSCGGEVEDFVCCSDNGASFRPSCDGQKLVCLPNTSREACGGGGGSGGAGGAGGAGGGSAGTAGASGAGAGGSTIGKACTPNKAGECGADEYCDLEGTACGTNSKDGVCVLFVGDCGIGCPPPDAQPCGCDGKRYCSECVMRSQGITPAPDESFCGGPGAATGAACGGIADIKCANVDDFCDYGVDSACGTNDGMGICTAKPTTCGDGCPAPEFQICACDGQKYCNSCEINKKGLSVAAANFCK